MVVQLGLEPHLNTSFKHYVLFIDEHSLASGKDFWGPLGDLVVCASGIYSVHSLCDDPFLNTPTGQHAAK